MNLCMNLTYYSASFPLFRCYVLFGRYFTSTFYLRCWMCLYSHRKLCHTAIIPNQRFSNHIWSPDSMQTSWVITRLVDRLREPCVVKLNDIRHAELGIGWLPQIFVWKGCDACKSFLCRTCTTHNTMSVYFLLLRTLLHKWLFYIKNNASSPQKKEPVVISKAGFQFSRLPLLELSRYHNQGVEHEHLKNFLAAYQAPLDPFEGDLFDLVSVKSAMRTLLQTNISPTSGEGDLSFLGRPPGIPNLTFQWDFLNQISMIFNNLWRPYLQSRRNVKQNSWLGNFQWFQNRWLQVL